ncbi:MAG: ATP synthase F1 subunit epsilon [Bacteroidetes bacterium]|jgi:F-type H+-transporting ATPase subunit epsilon|nr:ATP synthase F1 subunit epsilon [Bacteroidota bacterium]NBC26779.1 ATP synthase F1 subunit epsilon [Bacteroidota bacterium]
MATTNTIHAQVLTPEGSKFEGDVLSVTVPGSSGSFQMLHNHAPIVSSLDVGPVLIQKEDNTVQVYAVSGGFVEMTGNKVTLLAERATEPEDIDLESARKELEKAKQKVYETSSDPEQVRREIRIAENLISVGSNS